MTDISFYFTPISFDRENYQKEQIGGCIAAFTDEFPSIDSGSIAILYVPENRGSRTKQDQKTSSDFRKSFYQLYKGKNWNKSILASVRYSK